MTTTKPKPAAFAEWSHDVLEIKELLYSRKYKRCAARCEELQATASHPIHRTFLYFYQALSYESLGTSAHMYSANKLSLLNLAKDSFALALQNLPEPTVNNEHDRSFTGSFVESIESPSCTTLSVIQRYQDLSPPTQSSGVSPCDSEFCDNFKEEDKDSVAGASTRTSSSSVSSVHTFNTADGIPDFDKYSPRHDLFKTVLKNTEQPIKALHVTPRTVIPQQKSTNSTNHKARLSQSLSTTHCLAEDLVPTPLFRRTCQTGSHGTDSRVLSEGKSEMCAGNDVVVKIEIATECNSYSDACDKPDVAKATPTKSGSPLALDVASVDVKSESDLNLDAKPLPPLPFNHNPSLHIRLKSRRSRNTNCLSTDPTLPPQVRATSIQTLVAKYEDKIKPSSPKTKSTPYQATPITPRFRMIEQTFTLRDQDLATPPQSVHANRTRIPVPTNTKTPVLPASRSSNHLSQSLTPDTNTPCPRPSTRTHDNKPVMSRDKSKDQAELEQTQQKDNLNDAEGLRLKPDPNADTNRNHNHHSLSTPNQEPNPTSCPSSPSDSDTSTLTQHVDLFKQTLHTHLCTITTQIDTAQQVQDEHRQKSLSRCLSFWSFDVASPAPAGTPSNALSGSSVRGRGSVYERRVGRTRERVRRDSDGKSFTG